LNRARMNPHFFFNTLTSIQKLVLQEKNGEVMAGNLARFSNIMRETLESTYKEYISIEQEIEFLTQYLEVQKVHFPGIFNYEIFTAGELESDELLIPPMIIQPFVENSIEHAFAGLSYTGEIKVSFQKKNKELLIIITDNGKGLPSPDQKNNEHISRATQIIRDRIYLLNRKLKTKAAYQISNCENKQGAQVTIQLPLIYKD
ncbi:MAG TPA: histidine kinase, partial [Chitinophagaceae bacterium]|nr:histidine kinase [Chitinophagaceae bacterium]